MIMKEVHTIIDIFNHIINPGNAGFHASYIYNSHGYSLRTVCCQVRLKQHNKV
jgi:hypothetical protein